MSDNVELTLNDLDIIEGLDSLEGIDGIKAFDPAKHLNSKESIAAFVSFAIRSGDVEHFKEAIRIAARAEKMSKIAESAGLTREGAYTHSSRAISRRCKPSSACSMRWVWHCK